jgi:dihydroflavonol-4-reductase
MRTFVTGGNGFIGSAVVRRLVERGHAVRCLVRPTSDTRRIDDLPVERVIGDVRDAASLAAGLAGCDAVIHLAGLSSWNDLHSPRMDEIVVGGTRNVLDAARAAGGPRTVVVSTSVAVNGTTEPAIHDETSVLDLPLDGYVYSHAKARAEAVCREAAADGLPVVIVNPGEVFGPNDTALITACNLIDFATSWPVLVCHGGTALVHVEDVAEGIIAALERGRPGERYILAGENVTIRELAELTLDLLGRRKPVILVANGLLRWLAAIGTALRLPLPFNPAVLPYATRYWFVDNTRARTELGVSFRSARETLAPTLAWLAEIGLVAARRSPERASLPLASLAPAPRAGREPG